MKNFLLKEWFKLLISISFFIFSIAFLLSVRKFNNAVSVSFPPSTELHRSIYDENDNPIPVGVILQNGDAFTVWSSGTISKTKFIERQN